MFSKNALLGIVLTISSFTFKIESIDSLNQDSNNERGPLEIVKTLADAIVTTAKINAEKTIEEAKLNAATQIMLSEQLLEASQKEIVASEKFGSEAAKIIAPIAGAAICLYAAMKFYLIFNKYR